MKHLTKGTTDLNGVEPNYDENTFTIAHLYSTKKKFFCMYLWLSFGVIEHYIFNMLQLSQYPDHLLLRLHHDKELVVLIKGSRLIGVTMEKSLI